MGGPAVQDQNIARRARHRESTWICDGIGLAGGWIYFGVNSNYNQASQQD